MIDVVALGELLIDFACKEMDDAGYPLMKANPGGAPGNFLAALSKYGCKTAFIGKVGEDTFGRLLVNTCAEVGINTDGIIVDPDVFTTLAFVTIDETGNREFAFARKPGADTCLRFEEVNLSIIDECKDFHFGTLSLIAEPARSATIKSVEYAKQLGKMISFDPNLRKPLWDDLDRAKEEIKWGLSKADIVKISDEEIEFLWGDISYEDAANMLINEYNVSIVFITLGSKGCLYAISKGSGCVESPKVKPIDTTGAGDIFGGSALSRILKMNKAINDISLEELKDVTRFACTAASLSTENMGGISGVVDYDVVVSRVCD